MDCRLLCELLSTRSQQLTGHPLVDSNQQFTCRIYRSIGITDRLVRLCSTLRVDSNVRPCTDQPVRPLIHSGQLGFAVHRCGWTGSSQFLDRCLLFDRAHAVILACRVAGDGSDKE